MSIKKTIQGMIERSASLRGIVIKANNRIKTKGNHCLLPNLHSRSNDIHMGGKQVLLQCNGSGFLRECKVRMKGDSNRVTVGSGTAVYGEQGQTIYICGNDNQIVVGENCNLRKVTFFIRGSGNKIIVGNGCSAYNVQFHIEQDNNEINVDDGTTLHGREEGAIHMAAGEGSRILVGEDCMFAHSVQIRSTDSHSIIDLDGQRVNPAKDVKIGNHCWIGLRCIILKGTEISNHCVVAAGAVCSKNYPETNCILAGNPAKAVKRNVDWDRKC